MGRKMMVFAAVATVVMLTTVFSSAVLKSSSSLTGADTYNSQVRVSAFSASEFSISKIMQIKSSSDGHFGTGLLFSHNISIDHFKAVYWHNVAVPDRYISTASSYVAKYTIQDNMIYTYLNEQGLNLNPNQSQSNTTIVGKNFVDIITEVSGSISILSVYNIPIANNLEKNNNQVLTISKGSSTKLVNAQTTMYHRSYGWGQAWLNVGTIGFYHSVGIGNSAQLMGLISMVVGGITGIVLAADPMVAVVAIMLEAVAIFSWTVFLNEHTASNGEVIPYVEVGVSEGNWWHFYDLGAYGELGAYSNQYYSFNGQGPYSTPWQYNMFLTSDPGGLPTWHISPWPTRGPPW